MQIMLRHPPRKEDVTVYLLMMTRQPTAHPKPRGGGIPRQKPRELSPLALEPPEIDKGAMLDIRHDSKTVVDFLNSHAELEAPDCCGSQNIDLR